LQESSTSPISPSSTSSKLADGVSFTCSNMSITRFHSCLIHWIYAHTEGIVYATLHSYIHYRLLLCISNYGITDREWPLEVFDQHLVVFSFLHEPLNIFLKQWADNVGIVPLSTGWITNIMLKGRNMILILLAKSFEPLLFLQSGQFINGVARISCIVLWGFISNSISVNSWPDILRTCLN
jgi:hypothetical protein